MFRDDIDIFASVCDEDIENTECVPEVAVTPKEYFTECERKYSESIFIDITSYSMSAENANVRKSVYRLSYLLNLLFDMYEIEHSDVILFDISGIALIDDTIELRDCKTYKCVTKNNGQCIQYYSNPAVGVYVNFPMMTLKYSLRMLFKMLDSVWKLNKGRDADKLIFINVLFYGSVISYREYYINWYKHAHIDFSYKIYYKPNENMYWSSNECVKWEHFKIVKEWFMYRKVANDFIMEDDISDGLLGFLDKKIKVGIPPVKSVALYNNTN